MIEDEAIEAQLKKLEAPKRRMKLQAMWQNPLKTRYRSTTREARYSSRSYIALRKGKEEQEAFDVYH